MRKSELKRLCTIDPIGMAEKMARQESELTALRSQVAELQVKLTDAQDAASTTYTSDKQEPIAFGAFYFGGKQNGKLYAQCATLEHIKSYIEDRHRSDDSITLRAAPLYAAPINTAALIEQAKAEERERIGNLIHWPECWDTAAYPTLEDALAEIHFCNQCYDKREDAIRARKP